VKYPKECEVRKIAFRGTKLDLTTERMAELSEVNLKVNRNIKYERNTQGLVGEKWLISPSTGDCNDYAVTKRHQLLERGWPSRSLLLAEVVTRSGEHHLVVVVRTKQGDFVMDSLNSTIRPWAHAPYRWARVQSPSNPKYWSTVRDAGRSV
jgi:predicted transglutaminase-like cysteine proteinase